MSEAAVGMKCQELVEVITDYLEGAMAPADVERFDDHISLCPGCDTYLEQMRTTISALGHIPPESIDAEAEQKLLHAFRDWSYGR
jgi:anti-sigma factor RsiW